MTKGRARVAVVVVTHDAVSRLHRCLATVRRHTRDLPYQLVVVDDASRDGTGEFLRSSSAPGGAHLIFQSRNRGKAAAMNRAVSAIEADWYAFLDDDAEVSAGWLSRLLGEGVGRRPSPSVIGCRVLTEAGRIHSAEMLSWVGPVGGGEEDRGQRNYTRFCDAVAGTCCLVRGDVFKTIRYTEAMRQPYEDADFCFKARAAGMKVLYCGSVAVKNGHLLRFEGRQVEKNDSYMASRWGFPDFPDSHPLDRLRSQILRCERRRDWARMVQAARRLQRIDPIPSYAYGWSAMALSMLGRRESALRWLDRALGDARVCAHSRLRFELARERILRRPQGWARPARQAHP